MADEHDDLDADLIALGEEFLSGCGELVDDDNDDEREVVTV